MKYTDLPESSQPRRRLREVGGAALSDAELLAVALWISDLESAEELANAYFEAGSLGKIPRQRITTIRGLGDRYADALAAICELIRREMQKTSPSRKTIQSPKDAADLILYEMSQLEQEQFRVILLNTRNHVMRIETLYQGSVNSAQIRVGEVFKSAIRENATAIIVAHNHPSGDPLPSPDDVKVTLSIAQAGKLIDIELVDHLVIGGGRFVSMKERGLF